MNSISETHKEKEMVDFQRWIDGGLIGACTEHAPPLATGGPDAMF